MEKIKDNVQSLLRRGATIREVAQLLGVLLATKPGNQFAQLFTKRMEMDKNRVLKIGLGV